MCGSATVVPVDDQGNPFSSAAPGVAGLGAAPPAAANELKEVLEPLLTEALDYIRQRDKVREDRDVLLDAAESARRERLTHAKDELLGQTTTLIEKVTELTESLTAYVDTVLLKRSVREELVPIPQV